MTRSERARIAAIVRDVHRMKAERDARLKKRAKKAAKTRAKNLAREERYLERERRAIEKEPKAKKPKAITKEFFERPPKGWELITRPRTKPGKRRPKYEPWEAGKDKPDTVTRAERNELARTLRNFERHRSDQNYRRWRIIKDRLRNRLSKKAWIELMRDVGSELPNRGQWSLWSFVES